MMLLAIGALAGIFVALVILKPWELDYATYSEDYDNDSGWSFGDWFGGDGD